MPFSEFAGTYPDLLEAEETVAPSPNSINTQFALAPRDSPAKIKIINLEPTEIIPHLYIGARKDALNRDLLASLGVTCIVNVTKDCPNAFPDTIEYLQIPIDVCDVM